MIGSFRKHLAGIYVLISERISSPDDWLSALGKTRKTSNLRPLAPKHKCDEQEIKDPV